jgi:hypothetical protein
MAAKQTAIQTEGLTESLRALKRVDDDLGNEARELLRAAAKVIQVDAQGRPGRRPGGGSYPRRRGMVGRSATSQGAAVTLRGARYPWAWGAEFGAKRAWVFGRVLIQSRLRRRQFPVWRGNQFVVRGSSGPGWIIAPAIRANLDRVTKQVADGIDDLYDRAFSRAGVRRG